MPEMFLNKIRLIVLKHIENERFGVSELAAELGLSRSQFFRKVKTTFGKSASVLIREIRLDEGLILLRKDKFTASEISYKVGFSSPSYFYKCFHDRYGFTPGDYKKQIEYGIEVLPLQKSNKVSISKTLGVILVSILAIIIVVFSIFKDKQNLAVSSEVQENKISIAILPLKDLSENKNKDFLAVGLTDAITLELSKLEDLRVISRGSAMLFQDSIKLYADIAEKLGVDLLLEGSIIYNSERLRIIVQLIEPIPDEKHLWANKYDRKTSNIFLLADDISNQIAREINLVVAPEVKSDKARTIDPEAYELYLRARLLWSKQSPESVKIAIDYLKESIEIDSNFALSYTVLAEAYITMNRFINDAEEQQKNRRDSRAAINRALDKSIELDGTLAEAYITKGNILGKFDWDWEGMKEMAERGLKLSPSNLEGHILLSQYYIIKGEFDKALEKALVAEKLHPLNPKIACLVGRIYYFDKRYEESLAQYNKVLELHDFGLAWDGIGYVQYMMGQKEEALKSWKELQLIMGNPKMAKYFETYDVKESLNHWLEVAMNDSEIVCSSPSTIAQIHIFLNDKDSAIEYLELAYETKNDNLPIRLQRPHLEQLYDDPRFIEITKKVGVIINR